MKNLKLFSVLTIALFLMACEKDQVREMNPEFNQNEAYEEKSDGVYSKDFNSLKLANNTNISKISNDEINYRTYTSEAEYLADCLPTTHFDEKFENESYGYFGFNYTYFGINFESLSGDQLITLNVVNEVREIIYSDEILIGSSTFYALSSDTPMYGILFSSTVGIFNHKATGGYCDFVPGILDSDGDGIPDDVDPQPNSNNEATVLIDVCDSGVDNFEFGDGYTLSDKIDELEDGEYKNHGQYVRATSNYLAELVDTGIITNEEKEALMSCAGASSI